MTVPSANKTTVAAAHDAPALEVKQLYKRFGGLPAINGIDLSLGAGERHLLLGPNGSGKTTLFNLITGVLPADSGSVRLFGEDLSRLPVAGRAHLGMARTYQIITLFPKDTLIRNVVLSLLGLSSHRWNPLRSINRYADIGDAAEAVLETVGLTSIARRRLSEVAYGEQRRVELAMSLAQRPRILLLDEPLAGLSRSERRDIQDLLESFPRELTILLIEHDMDVALSFAERITVLHHGEVVTHGTRAEVVANPRTKEVYLGR
ncbi:MAG: ABC transporter ATP-binding protein [Xanthobacteraceae bacterium]